MVHYNAFISYNHNPRDIKIAHLLQQKIEHYKIPKDLASSPDYPNIERVFLDKGDLEVAGDLNEVIKEALEHTDYLIVICSPESKKSIWVRNEIEYFLQYHSLRNILTVITEGEPFDVLPDRLLSEEVIDDEGNVTVTPLEPLSCDYRMPIRKANKEELPRLVSALIGCRYDDLVQRQKAYKRRQQMILLGAASVILTAAITYLAWSNHQIKTSYNNTLKEQSMNLALQSQKALKGGDRIGAIQSALAALPSEEQDRPLVSEAALALCESMDIYKTNEEWTAVEQYSSEVSIKRALPFTCDGNDYISTLDNDGRVKIWNATNGREVFEEYTKSLKEDKFAIGNIEFADDKYLLLFSYSEIIALDIANETEKYRKPVSLPNQADDPLEVSAYSDKAICTQNQHLWVSASDRSNNNYILQFDTEGGNCSKAIPTEGSVNLLSVSGDARYLALVRSVTKDDYSSIKYLEILDIASGKVLHSVKDLIVSDIMFDSKGRLISCGFKEEPGAEYRLRSMAEFNPVYQSNTVCVKCYDPASGDEIWTADKTNLHTGLPFLEEADKGVFQGKILCTTGNISDFYDGEGNPTDQIIWNVNVCEYNHTNEGVFALLEDGSLCNYDAKEKSISVLKNTFKSPVLGAETLRESSTKVFIATKDDRNDSILIQYDYAGSDPKWTAYKNDILEYKGGSLLDNAEAANNTEDNYFALDSVSYEDSIVDIQYRSTDNYSKTEYLITNRKFEDASVKFEKAIAVDRGDYSYCGADKASSSAYFVSIGSSGDSKLMAVNLEDGSSSEKDIDFSAMDSDVSLSYYSLFSAGNKSCVSDIQDSKLYIPAMKQDSVSAKHPYALVVLCIDPSSASVKESIISDFDAAEVDGYDLHADINAVASRVCVADPEGLTTMYDFKGKTILKSDELSFASVAPCITDDGNLLILEPYSSDEYKMHVYNVEKGREENIVDLGQMSLTGYEQISLRKMSSNENLLAVGANAFVLMGSSCDLISRIDSYLDCNSEKSEIILGSNTGSRDGHVPYRPLEKIIEEANELIKERTH